MAKTKSSAAVKSLADALGSVFGENASEKGVDVWLDTGFMPLNKAISGSYYNGLPVGRMVEMFGLESCGKTALATNAMISAQKAQGLAMFMDHERSFMHELARKMGLETDPAIGNFIYQRPDTFEQSIDGVVKYLYLVRENDLIPEEAPIIVVWDSLAAMVPQSKLAKDAEEQSMHDSLALAKACSSAFPALAMHAEKTNACFLFLNQTRENPGVMFGDSTTQPGGKAPKFYSSVRIGLNRKLVKDKDKNVEKQEITAKVIKNKVSAPFREAKWSFAFREDGTGYLDTLGSSIDYLIEKEILKQSGAYVEFNGKKIYRSQLTEKIIESGQEDIIYDLIRKLEPQAA